MIKIDHKQFPNAKRLWVAYSGGVDSHVLLHAIKQSCLEIPITAVHINHQLNAQAQVWQQHCQDVCDALGIVLNTITIDASPQANQSPEQAARIQRYRALKKVVADNEYLLTAHHQDDQAETLLLQLLRGAGPKGLSAMPRLKIFAKGFCYRPLLNFSREQILEYAKQHHLDWVEDNSNQDSKFDRNFLRAEVMPLLKSRWPSMATTLSRTAQHCANASLLLAEIATEDLNNLKGSAANTLSIGKLNQLDSNRQCNALRTWLDNQNLPIPNTKRLVAVCNTVLKCESDKAPLVEWQGVQVRRYRDDIYAIDTFAQTDFENPEKLLQYFKQKFPQASSIVAQYRQPGQRVKRPHSEGSRCLKKLFQQWGIPPWQRDKLPLIFVDGELMRVSRAHEGVKYRLKTASLLFNHSSIQKFYETGFGR